MIFNYKDNLLDTYFLSNALFMTSDSFANGSVSAGVHFASVS